MSKVVKDELGELHFVVLLLGYVTFCFDRRRKQILWDMEWLIVIYITADKDVISVRILKIARSVMAVNQQFTLRFKP